MPPRLVVAAPASGHGKTTVATGLMAAWTARGLRVSPHKVGPDYIDPGYHALATGRPGRNLDAYMCGTELVAPLFAHGSRTADIAVVEGVMGLFDGATGHAGLASTAEAARLLDAPVVLVVDASAQGRSVAALVHGFTSYDRAIRLAGVILNRVGSPRHEEILRTALADGPPVLGALPRDPSVRVPSRHLGLVPAAERSPEAQATVASLAETVTRGCDLAALESLARTAPPVQATAFDPATAVAPRPVPYGALPGPASGASTARPARCGPPPVVAVAGGAAFTFGYAEHAELLRAAGADVVAFDPLRDEALPDGTAGIVIGGGFPEEHAGELSANAPLRRAIADAAERGVPVAAECAGLAYLSRSLDGSPMCGVLDATAAMTGRLTLGYREARAATASVLAAEGAAIRGHEFHRTTVTPYAAATPAWTWHDRGATVREGTVRGRIHASYLHTHWAAHPEAPRRLVRACAGVRTGADA
ncbi:MAG TPA: cobyrinate a,c-diamide synthase [Streptosporangiaceae bacterium]